MNKRRDLFIAAALVGCAVGAAPGSARAQSATAGAVQGVVTDAATGQVMTGVTVVATSPVLQGTQSALSDANGFYKITNLPPGVYVVAFYYASITVKRTDITVNANRTTPVFVKIDTAQSAGEVIEVQGTPNIDTTSTTQGITLGEDYLRNIPVPGRTFEDALGAAAGSAGDDLGVSFSGSTSLENQYIVDGVNTTGLTFGTVGSPVINEFIEEIEIITGGYQAEFGRATGGVVNVVTQSGSNEFHGSVFSTVTSDFLAIDPERNPSQISSIDATSTLNYNANFGFDLGGPIIKDKLWFFVGFSPTFSDVDDRPLHQAAHRLPHHPGRTARCPSATRVCTRTATGTRTWSGNFIYEDIPGGTEHARPAEQQLPAGLEGELRGVARAPGPHLPVRACRASGEAMGVLGERAATSVDISTLNSDLAAKWTSKFNDNRTEVEAVLGWHREHFETSSIVDEANSLPLQNLLFGNLGTWGLRGTESMATVDRLHRLGRRQRPVPAHRELPRCRGRLPHRRPGRAGRRHRAALQRAAGRHPAHQGARHPRDQGGRRRGAEPAQQAARLQRRRLLRRRGSATRPAWTRSGWASRSSRPTSTAGSTSRRAPTTTRASTRTAGRIRTTRTRPLRCQFLGPTDVEGNTLNWAAYLRDSWQILPNLTLNAGVRYEEQYLRFAEHLRNTIDPFTLERRGKNAMELRNMWAPRVGLLYDWTKEGRSKVFGSYGRFYESIPMDINDRSFGGEALLRQIYPHVDGGSQPCGPPDGTIGAPPGTACMGEPSAPPDLLGGNGVLIAPGIGPQYMDEFIVGGEYELIDDLKVGVTLKRRTMGRVIEDVSVDGAADLHPGQPGRVLARPGARPGERDRRSARRRRGRRGRDPSRISWTSSAASASSTSRAATTTPSS